jgi:HSP20 family protein
MLSIDETIGQVEALYRRVTGRDAPMNDSPYAVIPPEKDPVLHVEEQMERLHAALAQLGLGGQPGAAAWTPPISVSESPQEILVCMDLPGVPVEALEVAIQHNLLVVTGTRPPPNGAADARPRLIERPVGPFRRVVVLPPLLPSIDVNAQLKDGVLTIRIPRSTAGTLVRPIQVK